MRRLFGLILTLTAASIPLVGAVDVAHASETSRESQSQAALRPDEAARLARGETIVRHQTVERGDRRYIGGVTYTVVDASGPEVAAVFDNVELLRKVLPKTKRAKLVGTVGNDQLLEIASGNAVMEAEYTLRVRRGASEARFWLDPSRPHGIDDAWGFFRYESFVGPSGEERVLLTYGILVDVGPGIVRELFEEKVRTALLSVPQRVRRTVAERALVRR